MLTLPIHLVPNIVLQEDSLHVFPRHQGEAD